MALSEAIDALFSDMTKTEPTMRCERNLPLSAYTTFRIGGPADLAVFPSGTEMLTAVIRLCKAHGVLYAIVGRGSNLLVDDRGFRGCVILTAGLDRLTVCDTDMTVSAGVPLSALACAARDASLGGLAFAYGIPGSLGGAVYMNAGAYGGALADVIKNVTFYDTDTDSVRTFTKEECGFGYRTSVFQSMHAVILAAEIALADADRAVIGAEMEDYMARRRDKQPLNYPSAGSAFKRYPGYYTAQLIDELGMKGLTVGGAQVSEKHAGFIINRGNATAEDVRRLIAVIKEKIKEAKGISIEQEIRELS